MKPYAIHVCQLDELPPVTRWTKYQGLRKAALEAGRFSVFEATANKYAAKLFTQLCEDPTLEITRLGFPWTGVQERPALSDETGAAK